MFIVCFPKSLEHMVCFGVVFANDSETNSRLFFAPPT